MNAPPFYPTGLGGGDGGGGGGGGDSNNPQSLSRKEIPLQGPRPNRLQVNKVSHKIKKPPLPAPKPPLPSSYPWPNNALAAARNSSVSTDDRQPVIIYDVSPKVIHAEASDFRSVVQRLTGLATYPSTSTPTPAPTTSGTASGGVWASDAPISPAARFAVMERASPTAARGMERERGLQLPEIDFGGGGVGEEVSVGLMEIEKKAAELLDLGQFPGILSPAPANLPALPSGLFSPVADPQGLFGFSDSSLMSPFVAGGGGNSFLPSPSYNSLFSSLPPVFSPGGFFDLSYNIFDS